MKKKFVIPILCALLFALCAMPFAAEAANKFWWGSCLTGGGDCLDGIDGDDLTAGDGAIVMLDSGSNTPELYLYRLHASSADEDSPRVIAPDANPGTKRWHLANTFAASFQTVAVDGYNRIKLTNNTARAPTASSMEIYPEGNLWKLNVNGTEYTLGPIDDSAGNGDTTRTYSADKIFDLLVAKLGGTLGATANAFTKRGADASTAAASTVTEDGTTVNFQALNMVTTGTIAGRIPLGADVTGNIAHNTTDLHGKMYKFTAAATVTLDAAADAGYGASVCYRVRDASEAAVIDVDNAEKINLRGTALAVGVAITATGAGEYVCLIATTDTDGSGTDGWETWGITTGWASQ